MQKELTLSFSECIYLFTQARRAAGAHLVLTAVTAAQVWFGDTLMDTVILSAIHDIRSGCDVKAFHNDFSTIFEVSQQQMCMCFAWLGTDMLERSRVVDLVSWWSIIVNSEKANKDVRKTKTSTDWARWWSACLIPCLLFALFTLLTAFNRVSWALSAARKPWLWIGQDYKKADMTKYLIKCDTGRDT